MTRYNSQEAAQFVGLSPASWRSYGSRGARPEPDGREGGRPYWYESTLLQWMAQTPRGRALVALNSPLHRGREDEVASAIHLWIAGGDDREPAVRLQEFLEACQVSEERIQLDGFAKFGLTLAAWVTCRHGESMTLAVAEYPWHSATWQQAGQLFFLVMARLGRDRELTARINSGER